MASSNHPALRSKTHNYASFAGEYAALGFNGTYLLAFRDIPEFIGRYTKGTKVLDHGCGAGRSTRFLKSLGLDVTGVDISEDMLREARTLDPDGSYSLVEGEALSGFAYSSFDVAFQSIVLLEYGSRLTIDKHTEHAQEILRSLEGSIGTELVTKLLETDQSSESGIAVQRENVAALKGKLASSDKPEARNLLSIADVLVKRSVWILGGDGWAYDIGYGGLDHVLASTRNINVLVLDTEVYSNTGGQMSKSTPKGAVAKFAAGGKKEGKKELGLFAMAYGTAYVAHVAFGANDSHTIKAFLEAEAYPGPSIIIAYSHCIAHGYDLRLGLEQQKNAVNSGYWPLYRFNPALRSEGKNPFSLDSKKPSLPLEKYMYNETRFRMLTQMNPDEAARLLKCAQAELLERFSHYELLAGAGQYEEPLA